MGKAIKKFGWKRNDLVISTKVGYLYRYDHCTYLGILEILMVISG